MLDGRITDGEAFASVLAGIEKSRSAFALNDKGSTPRGGGGRRRGRRFFGRILIKVQQVHFVAAQIQFEADEDLQVFGIEDDVELLLLVDRFEQFAIGVTESDEEVFGETLLGRIVDYTRGEGNLKFKKKSF